MSASNMQMAVILLASLPIEEVAFLIGQLKPAEIDQISQCIRKLTVIKESDQRMVAALLRRSESRQGLLPPQEAAPMRQNSLNKLASRELAAVLRGELPQTIAIALKQLAPPKAAAALAHLATEQQTQVIRRLAQSQPADPNLVLSITNYLDQTIRRRNSPLPPTNSTEDIVAQILHFVDHATERSLMVNLSEEDPELAARLEQKVELLRASTNFGQELTTNTTNSNALPHHRKAG